MSIIHVRCVGLVVLIFTIFGKSATSELLAEQNLVEALLSNYSIYARPVKDPSQALLVSIDVLLKQIVDVDERQQLLTSKVWMRLWWHDVNLVWNPAEFGNVSSVRIAGEKLWRPDITLYDDMLEANYDPFVTAAVNFDGTVAWFYPTVLKSACQLDVYYFPWDQQICELRFGSWSYDMTKLDITNRSIVGNRDFFDLNGEWNVIGFPNRRHVAYYTCCLEPYSDVTYYLIIRRKPLYHMFHLILPCIFITATTVLVFYLPAQSGEKISLSVTVLLALTVFLLLVGEALPPQSNSVPIVAKYFGATIVLLAISTSFTVLVLNVHHRGSLGYPVPPLVQLVVLDWLARMLCLRKCIRGNRKGQLDTAKTEANDAKDEGKSAFRETCMQSLASVYSIGTAITQLDDDEPTTNVTYQGETNSETDIPGLDLDRYIDNTQFYVDKPTTSETHRVETTSRKQIRDILFHMQQSLKQICATLFETQQRQMSQEDADECRHSWMMVAMVIDRLMFLIFTLLTITVSIALLLNHPTYDYDHTNQPLDTMD